MNRLASHGEPFLFIIDFDCVRPVIIPIKNLPEDIFFKIRGTESPKESRAQGEHYDSRNFNYRPVSYDRYMRSFRIIRDNLEKGNTYLANLTFPSFISSELDLRSVYHSARAPYKLLFRDDFVVYSPECFVRIKSGKIYTFPMKGTINASIKNAEEEIISDPKEKAEHITVVDLLRNDIGKISRNVRVEKFRYTERIKTSSSEIIQVSSVISGTLGENYRERLGEILFTMLPAGSVTGAPKKRTVEIIKEAEGYQRGYYTGVFGLFDGRDLDSAVMIRFIEKTKDGGFIYKSGGGITIYSDPEKEYSELMEKIYVPSD
ncbi:MAG: aminodeoxychorismate synthase component I [Fibrobacterota bacterium]